MEYSDKPDHILERVAKIVVALVGILVAMTTLLRISPILAYSVVWFIALYLFILILPRQGVKFWRMGRRICILLLISVAPCFLIHQIRISKSAESFRQTTALFERNLSSQIWIAYEPTAYDPYENRFPTSEDIEKELKILLKARFTGLITFSSQESLGLIPSIAKNIGFNNVIMGILDVTKNSEIQNALEARPYVDAYCVGHMFPDYGYTIYDILDKIDLFRKRTKRPISTTLRPNGYKVFPEISNSIDFFFPDIHGNWYSEAIANKILEQTKAFIKEVSELQTLYPNKPILLKMISFPAAEVPGASPEEQYRFYRALTEYVKSSMEFPERVYPSYFSGFDIPWKSPKRGWPLGERHIGFFNINGTPKEAEIDGNKLSSFTAIDWSRAKISTLKRK